MTRPLFCFYGDDCTGSTDALESLAANGVETVLFLDPPSVEELAAFPGIQAFGVAGESRSRGPEWMSANLPGIFEGMAQAGAEFCHYKVCSTFDSSPGIGSIGRAIEIGQQVFNAAWSPVVVAAPHLGRYVLFGNLFAAGGGAVHRIDRHPTMRQHPVTPMDEGDLRLHLAKQTALPMELVDILALTSGAADSALDTALRNHARIVVFDGLDDRTLLETGRLLWTGREPGSTFAAGSSGLIRALVRYWREAGLIAPEFEPASPEPVDRVIVMSGSCSPVTESQIRWAMNNGFEIFRIGPDAAELERVRAAALAALSRGVSVVLYSALGPADRMAGWGGEGLGQTIGDTLKALLLASGVRRAVVSGGDTSSHSVRRLGIDALTFVGLLTPGSPLCRAHAPGSPLDGIDLVLKGGQMGPEHFFDLVRRIDP